MPEDKWLWNEPKTWHDIDRALQEISVLLDYLGTRPDGRLLAYFQDTQSRVADGAAKRTVPPCGSYTEFLNLNLQIRSAFQTGRPDLLPQMPAAAVGQPQLSAEGFVDLEPRLPRRGGRTFHRELDPADPRLHRPPLPARELVSTAARSPDRSGRDHTPRAAGCG